MSIREKLVKRAVKAGVSLNGSVADSLTAYFELLRRWNRKISLTALPVEVAGDEAIDRLLIEPVIASQYLPPSTTRVLDIGTGGGSPAIPMRLASAKMSLRMVESKTRKAAFLREVVRTLELADAEVDAVRFEELLARPSLHDASDVVTLRAVRVERKTLAEVQSFLRPGGQVFLFGTASPISPSVVGSNLFPFANHVLMKQWGSFVEILEKRS